MAQLSPGDASQAACVLLSAKKLNSPHPYLPVVRQERVTSRVQQFALPAPARHALVGSDDLHTRPELERARSFSAG